MTEPFSEFKQRQEKTVWRDGMIICPRRAALHNVFVLAPQPTKKRCANPSLRRWRNPTLQAGTRPFITLKNVHFYTCQPGFSYSECGGLTWFYNPVITLQHFSTKQGYCWVNIEFHVITLSDRNLQQSNSHRSTEQGWITAHTPDTPWHLLNPVINAGVSPQYQVRDYSS